MTTDRLRALREYPRLSRQRVDARRTFDLAETLVTANGRTCTGRSAVEGGATADKLGPLETSLKASFPAAPAGAEASVEVEKAMPALLSKGLSIRPLQHSEFDINDNGGQRNDENRPQFAIDERPSAQDAPYPPSPAVIGERGVTRGRHMGFVSVFPRQWPPARRKLGAGRRRHRQDPSTRHQLAL